MLIKLKLIFNFLPNHTYFLDLQHHSHRDNQVVNLHLNQAVNHRHSRHQCHRLNQVVYHRLNQVVSLHLNQVVNHRQSRHQCHRLNQVVYHRLNQVVYHRQSRHPVQQGNQSPANQLYNITLCVKIVIMIRKNKKLLMRLHP